MSLVLLRELRKMRLFPLEFGGGVRRLAVFVSLEVVKRV